MSQATVAATSKGERTRERILEAALGLFAGKGYEATTMRDIAAAAGCSLGLAYRYFDRKEALVLALYARLARELEEAARELPRGTLGERFERAMRLKLELVRPYREAFGALFGAALTPHSGVAVLGPQTADVRERVGRVFALVVAGATDAPRPRHAPDLARVLYVAHLGLLLFWLHDRTPGERATDELLAFARDTLGLARPLLALPPVARTLARLARALEPVFGGPLAT
jgi:AcrR family transcriptional regulator